MPKPKAKTKFKKNDKLIVKEIDYDIDNEKLSESIPEKKESIDILALKAALASFEKTIGISLVQMRQGVSSMEKFNKELNDLTKLVLEFESNSKERDSALSTRIELLEHDIKDVKEDGKKDIEDIKKIIADYFKSFNENICPKELRQRCLKKAENKKTYFKWFGKILNGITFGLFSKINDKIIAGIVGSAITIMLIETIRKAINALTDFFSKIGGTP